MHAGMSEFLDEQRKGLAELVENFRKSRVAAARKAAVQSAARIKALNVRVRELARSGVRLSNISQGAAESLIELQAEIVTAALTDAADQLERATRTVSVPDLVRDQAEVLKAARERIVDDIARTVKILKAAAGDVREVAARSTAAATATPKKTVRRPAKAKRAVRKSAVVKRATRRTTVKAKPRAKARSRRTRAR